MKPQVEASDHSVRVLGKISKQHPKSVYDGLVMSFQLNWQYLQKTVPRVGHLMGPIQEDLREKLFSALFEGGNIDANFWKFLGHSINRGRLGILEPRSSVGSG